jgi:hypothetical protein
MLFWFSQSLDHPIWAKTQKVVVRVAIRQHDRGRDTIFCVSSLNEPVEVQPVDIYRASELFNKETQDIVSLPPKYCY